MSRPLFLSFALVILGACNRSQPSEPPPPPPPVDSGAAPASLAAMARAIGEAVPSLNEGDAGSLRLGKKEPDWDLDAADPAKDYVERYINATRRYKLERPCVHAQTSRVENGRTLVDTRDTPDAHCRGTGAVRDTFAVDVPNDRLELADPARGEPLADWPDGSAPGGMPTASPKEGPPMNEWNSPLRKALEDLMLTPLRIQFYGRGSYPLLTVAGWHAPIARASSPAELATAAQALCKASVGFPLGIVTAMDRSTVLRVKCPATTRWQEL
jgi:hypothetical protein